MVTVKKNFCETCKRNIGVEGMFFTYRVGKYQSENDGVSTRRCLSDEEMCAKGWLLPSLCVKAYVNNSPRKIQMDTWIIPEYLQKLEDVSRRDMSPFMRGSRNRS